MQRSGLLCRGHLLQGRSQVGIPHLAQPVLPITQLPPVSPGQAVHFSPPSVWDHLRASPKGCSSQQFSEESESPHGLQQSQEQLQANALCKMCNSSLHVPWLTTAYFFWDPLLHTTAGDKEYKNLISTKQLLYSWKMKVQIVKEGK